MKKKLFIIILLLIAAQTSVGSLYCNSYMYFVKENYFAN